MEHKVSRNGVRLSIVTACLMSLLSGCVYLIVGGIGAVGGYVVSPDTVEGISEQDQSDVWDVAKDTIAVIGVIEDANEQAGMITANVQRSKVVITIVPISNSSVKVNVKARKYFLPRISLAQEIFVKIMTQLNG